MAVLILGVGVCVRFSLPPASAMIVSCETARIAMKMHAYFREKMLNCLYKNGDVAKFIPQWAVRQGQKIEDID